MSAQALTRAEGGGLHVDPLPPFAGMDGAIREALPMLRPLARVRVSETATRRAIESGGQWVPWRPDVAPYMTEPMDLVTSRRFDSIAFVGPARCSKSEALVINPLAHAILAQPRSVAVFSPRKQAAVEWSMGALDPLIMNSPELRACQMRGKGGDNIHSKRFRGGTRLTIDWPAKDRLAQRSLSLVIGTDYDAFPEDIGGDGGAFALMRKRTEAAGSRGMTVVESSPRHPILDEAWRQQSPHQAPPCDGIVAIYNRGTRARLYWTCRDCKAQFEPRFERLRWPEAGSAHERGAAAYMECPHCGGVTESGSKRAMNAGAQWLHEEEDGTAVPLADLQRITATASYWLPGPAAALASWAQIVTRWIEAEALFESTGGEGDLRAVTNTEMGLPYLPRARAASEGLSEEALRQGASDHDWGVAPARTAFILVAVDVQVGRFAVQVEAWQEGLERVVIDRFDLFNAPETAPAHAGRRIEPGRYAEDWDALLSITEKTWPLAGDESGAGLRALGVVIDGRGEPGVTPNAYGFWRRSRAAHRNRFHIVMGRPGDAAKRAEVRHPESAHAGKRHIARDVPVIRAGTDRLKDEVAASLLRREDGARKLHIPRGAPAEIFAEYAAERRGDKGWRIRPGIKRNEALDLSVYGLALAIVLGAESIDWTNPPAWAVPGPGNMMRAAGGGDVPTPEAAQRPATGWAVRKPKRKW